MTNCQPSEFSIVLNANGVVHKAANMTLHVWQFYLDKVQKEVVTLYFEPKYTISFLEYKTPKFSKCVSEQQAEHLMFGIKTLGQYGFCSYTVNTYINDNA